MRPRQPIPQLLLDTAAAQAGVVTRQQAIWAGLSERCLRRLVAEGCWMRLARGIYQVSGLPPAWRSLAWAGTLVCEGAAVRGHAAARLWGFHEEETFPIGILLPPGAKSGILGGWWEFSRTRVGFRAVGSPPRLDVEHTVLDLCAVNPDSSSVWVTQAVGGRRTTVARLREALGEQSRHPARRQLGEVLGDVDEGCHSPLELTYRRDVERAHGLDPGQRQVRSGTGGYVRDVTYDEGLVVELDGRRGHDGAGFFRDIDRDNYHLVYEGLQTLRVGWKQCHEDPCRVARVVAALRRSLGWTGDLRRCRRCRLVPEAMMA